MKILFRLCLGKPPTAASLCKCSVTDFSVDLNGNPCSLFFGPNPSAQGPFPFVFSSPHSSGMLSRMLPANNPKYSVAGSGNPTIPLKNHKSSSSPSQRFGLSAGRNFVCREFLTLCVGRPPKTSWLPWENRVFFLQSFDCV